MTTDKLYRINTNLFRQIDSNAQKQQQQQQQQAQQKSRAITYTMHEWGPRETKQQFSEIEIYYSATKQRELWPIEVETYGNYETDQESERKKSANG